MYNATFGVMKIAVRRRIGETRAGTFRERAYEGQADGAVTDEIGEAINDAQLFVARDIYDPDTNTLERRDTEIPIVNGTDIYTMPHDFVAVEECWHIRLASRVRLMRQGIKERRRYFDKEYRGGFYHYYEPKRGIATYYAEGVAQQESETELRDLTASFGQVRVGDRVLNLTDGSEAEVEGFRAGILQNSTLFGGRANRWRYGDQYGIATAEENRWALLVYPRISTGDRGLYTGTPTNFELNAGEVVQQVRVRFASLPDDYESDEPILFQIVDENGTLADDMEGMESIVGVADVRVGWQDIPFGRFQLQENTQYSLQALRESLAQLTVAEISLHAPSNDKLLVTYARTPRRMVNDKSVCELPVEFLEPVYERAKIILQEKVRGIAQGSDLGMYTVYEHMISKCKMNLRTRDEGGVFYVEVGMDGEYVDYPPPGDHQWTDWYF